MPRLRVALAQLNPVLGDLDGNSRRIVDAALRAAEQGAQVLAVGECALSGYPIEDLAGRAAFLRACTAQLHELAAQLAERGLGELIVVVGHPDGPHEASTAADDEHTPSAIAQNCASVLQHGSVQARYAKHHLPNYAVFDEHRTFIPGREQVVLDIGGARVALLICEDLWRDAGPVAALREAQPDLIVTINASPFERDKQDVRLPLVQQRAQEAGAPLAYVNIVGGQDDLVFDGDSLVVDATGRVVARAPQFEEHVLVTDIELRDAPRDAPPASVTLEPRTAPTSTLEPTLNEPGPVEQQVWNALVLGTRDYIEKNRFPSVVLGLSGGIDSAVCAVIAADAIGPDRVHAISMPSRYSSQHSRTDADELVDRVGIHYSVEPIADLVSPIEQQLQLSGVAAENLQARIRAIVLMASSNMHGHLLLTTGNKSEISVGYSTIYGDSAGGFAPIRDVPKSLVWQLAAWRNEHAAATGHTPPIPENSITKPPSAELRPDQVDQDSLPPYDVLDPILDAYVTENLGAEEIAARGYDLETIVDVVRLVDRSEWKRRQGAIGPKISAVAFGRDRRLPITYRPSQ